MRQLRVGPGHFPRENPSALRRGILYRPACKECPGARRRAFFLGKCPGSCGIRKVMVIFSCSFLWKSNSRFWCWEASLPKIRKKGGLRKVMLRKCWEAPRSYSPHSPSSPTSRGPHAPPAAPAAGQPMERMRGKSSSGHPGMLGLAPRAQGRKCNGIHWGGSKIGPPEPLKKPYKYSLNRREARAKHGGCACGAPPRAENIGLGASYKGKAFCFPKMVISGSRPSLRNEVS